MKRYLLDTHILIWWLDGGKKLSKDLSEILNGNEMKIVSVASFWEMAIKLKTKKLKLKKSLDYIIKNLEFHVLSINIKHVLKTNELKDYHKDPFDRILIAQSLVEECELLTMDSKIKKYF